MGQGTVRDPVLNARAGREGVAHDSPEEVQELEQGGVHNPVLITRDPDEDSHAMRQGGAHNPVGGLQERLVQRVHLLVGRPGLVCQVVTLLGIRSHGSPDFAVVALDGAASLTGAWLVGAAGRSMSRLTAGSGVVVGGLSDHRVWV